MGPFSDYECPPPPSLSEPLARAKVLATSEQPASSPHRDAKPPNPEMDFSVDFGAASGVQTRGKKAKQKAAKAASQAKWFESDNEGEGNAAGDGGDGAGGDGNGGSAGGDGGGDDNNGGGGDDDWDFGGSKKKNKKNKKKQEEEEKRKQEEEEAANAANPLSWADETNNAAEDDWTTGFTSKKDKKKKNKKTLAITHSILTEMS